MPRSEQTRVPYLDFHTHLLPNMDDGSRSVEESLEMIRKMLSQRVGFAAAVPHFYASSDDPVRFFERRKNAYRSLRESMAQQRIKFPIRIGAEVNYFVGITVMDELPQFRIQGSNLLLLEMPFSSWNDRTVSDILELTRRSEYQIVLAHVERYLSYKGNRYLLNRFASHGVKMQVNASSFEGFFGKRRMLSLYDEGLIHFIGSDCHNSTSRPPNAADAYECLAEARGQDAVSELLHHGADALIG